MGTESKGSENGFWVGIVLAGLNSALRASSKKAPVPAPYQIRRGAKYHLCFVGSQPSADARNDFVSNCFA